MVSDPTLQGSTSYKYRSSRMILFNKLLNSSNIIDGVLLDVGGTISYWQTYISLLTKGTIKRIDIINLPPVQETSLTINDVELNIMEGDALSLSKSSYVKYDVIFSNSVIEHVGSLRNQKIFAENIYANSNYHFIQTPNKLFIMEPHFYLPFFQFYPLTLRTFLHNKFKLGFIDKADNWLQSRIDCEDVRLMTYTEMTNVFPRSNITREYFLGLTKSLIASNMTCS